MDVGTSKGLIITGLAIAFLLPILLIILYLVWHLWYEGRSNFNMETVMKALMMTSTLSLIIFLIGMFIFIIGIMPRNCSKDITCEYQEPPMTYHVQPEPKCEPEVKQDCVPCNVKREVDKYDVLVSF